MKLGVTTALFLLFASNLPRAEQKSIPKEHQKEGQQAPAPSGVSPQTAAPPTEPAAATKGNNPSKKPESTWDKAFPPESWPNWALVIVGTGGIFVGLWTLRLIKRQSVSMRRQTKILRASVRVAEENAKAARDGATAARDNAIAAKEGAEATKQNIELIVNKERARLTIEIFDLERQFSPIPPGHTSILDVKFKVCFFGYTPAFIINAGAAAFVRDSREPFNVTRIYRISLPPFISPTTPSDLQYATIFSGIPTQEEIDAILNGEKFVHFRGLITYNDAFDRPRRTTFGYVWEESVIPGLSGNWKKYPKPEDNQIT